MVNPERRYTHGGILAALIDLAADFAMIKQTGRGVPTIDMRVDYHRAAMPGDLIARGKVVRFGWPVHDRRSRDHRLRWQADRHRPRDLFHRAAKTGMIGKTTGRTSMKIMVSLTLTAALSERRVAADNPDWAYPETPTPQQLDNTEMKSVPGSSKQYTQAQIDDPFNPPDWFPDEHPAMPQIVAHGGPSRPGAPARSAICRPATAIRNRPALPDCPQPMSAARWKRSRPASAPTSAPAS